MDFERRVEVLFNQLIVESYPIFFNPKIIL